MPIKAWVARSSVAYWNPKVGPAQDSPPYRGYGQWGVNLEFC